MAPKEPYKVHSLTQHIADTQKGVSNGAQFNRRPGQLSGPALKKTSGSVNSKLFGSKKATQAGGDSSSDTSSSSSSSSDSDSDSDDGADFMRKLGANVPPKRSKKDEIADSDGERSKAKTNGTKGTHGKNEKSIKKESIKPEPSSSGLSHIPSYSKQAKGAVQANGASSTSETSSESDSESDSTSSSGSDSESESKSEAKSKAAKPTKPVKADRKQPAAKASKDSSSESKSDSESESESDSDSDSESKSEKNKAAAKKKPVAKPAAPHVNGKQDDASSSSSSEDESSDAESEAAEPTRNGVSATTEASSSESEESENEAADESMHIVDRNQGQNKQLAIRNFVSPDFVLRSGEHGADAREIADVCKEANAQGKQFWYFTAPSNVPISVIQDMEVPMDSTETGERAFSLAGEDYGFSPDTVAPKSTFQILIPTSDGTRYQAASQGIDHVMHIKRVTKLPASNSTGATGPRQARPQPKGLKARFQPFGVNSPMGEIGPDTSADHEPDVPMEDAPALPVASSSKQKSLKKDKKRKQGTEDATIQETVSPAVPKKKKRKCSVSDDEAAAAAEQLMGESISAEARAKLLKQRRQASPDLGSTPLSASKKKAASTTGQSDETPKKSKKSQKTKTDSTPGAASAPRQTAVPLPPMPGPSQSKDSPVPLPQTAASAETATPLSKEDKKAKKRKEKSAEKAKASAASSQTPVQSSSQPSAAGGAKVTPVPLPQYRSSN